MTEQASESAKASAVGYRQHAGEVLARPMPRAFVWAFTALLIGNLAWLFWEPLSSYWLQSDDFEYLSASRTWDRAFENLFRAHNTHIVPAWRVVTCLVAQAAVSLERLHVVLPAVAFGTLAFVCLGIKRLVARESGQEWVGFAAMILMGTTSVVRSSATWYSSGQTLWAVLAIVGMLLCLQRWRSVGGALGLLLGGLAAATSGWFWTIGHVAGPMGAVYLWADGRTKSRLAAFFPLGATLLAVALSAALGARTVNVPLGLQGPKLKEGINLVAGASHTLQAIPERLVVENLGLDCETSLAQGFILSSALLCVWLWSWRKFGPATPLEWAGVTCVAVAYFVEWSFRGYLPYLSLRGIVPWYDTIPHFGLVLLASGALARGLGFRHGPTGGSGVARCRWGDALVLLMLQVILLATHASRVERLRITDVPPMSEEEARTFLTQDLRYQRALYLAREYARLQRLDLIRLDRANAIARQRGIGRAEIAQVFGRIQVLELPEVYDALGLFELPSTGTERDPARVRAALSPWLVFSQPPRVPEAMLRSTRNTERGEH